MRRAAKPVTGYFRAHDKTRLYYVMDGPANASTETPVICFCYGLACSKLQWKYQWQYFRKHYRVVYMDYRAHNRSNNPKSAKSVTIEQIAKDLNLLFDELNLKNVHLFGHSLGVNIILEAWRQNPTNIGSLALVCGTPRDPFETMFHHNFIQIVHRLTQKVFRLSPELLNFLWKKQASNRLNIELVKTVGFNRKYASPSDVSEYLQLVSSMQLKYFLHLSENFANYDCCYWLDEINVPTLIVGGDSDLITPLKTQKLMHKLIAGSQMEIVPEGSHCVQMEQKKTVNQILENFLAGLESV